MKQAKRRALILGGLAFLCLAAYVSATYILSPAIVDSGGGRAESASYQLDCSIGGPVVAPVATGGTAESPGYKLQVNSVAMLAEGAQKPSAGGGGGGCVGAAGGAGPLTLLLPLGVIAFLLRRRETVQP